MERMYRFLAMRWNPPETRFARSRTVSIAYQVIGSGPTDVVLVPGFVSHLELNWQNPLAAEFLGRLASFSRLIMFDKRGTGLSDRPSGLLPLKERMDDVRAVMDAVGSRRAVLLGVSEGGPMSIMFAATYPKRVSALILYGSLARGSWAADFPWAGKPEEQERDHEEWKREWGGPVKIELWAPSLATDDRFRQWLARYMRASSSPGAIVNLFRMNAGLDARTFASAVTVPTMIIHRAADHAVSVEHGRCLAKRIRGATYVELKGKDHLWYVGDMDSIIAEIRRFVTGGREDPAPRTAAADLSPREMQVAARLLQRLSTSEIAGQLFISGRTVSKHLEHVYLKLNAKNRSDLRRILLRGDSLVTTDPFW